MSITNELREWAVNHRAELDMGQLYPAMIECIADRIDAEHERQLEVLYRDMSDAEYVKLPVDADGEYIHVGDVMESKGSDFLFGEASFEVHSMRCDECGWEVYDRLGDRYAPSLLCHHHAPTVEDVLMELLNEAEHFHSLEEERDAIAEFAAKLQLKEDA